MTFANDNTAALALPFAIGAAVSHRDSIFYIASITPAAAGVSLMIGGPVPMAPIKWDVSLVSKAGECAKLDEHAIAHKLLPHVDHCADIPALRARADELAAQRLATYREENAARDRREEAARAEFQQFAPVWAKAAIIAELHQDASDGMSDYFNHHTTRRVVIGWSRHTRDLFAEMRKAAALFPDTAHLADAPADAENREKYSMGGGYYLKNGYRHCDGWAVKKTSVDVSTGRGLGGVFEIADCANGQPESVETVAAETSNGGRFIVSEHTHTKKGFQMWIAAMPDRVERDTYDSLLESARALGGWYSRAWSGTPAGFAFKSAEKAAQFVADNSGAGEVSAPTKSTPKAAPAPRKPSANPAEKLRGIAEALQPAIDKAFSPRLSNTPKRAREAGNARNEGVQLERAQKAARALAAAHDAGAVPSELAGVTTRKELCEIAREGINHSGGYYDCGRLTGEPYPWRDAVQNAKAVALFAMLKAGGATAGESAARADAEIAAKVDAVRFAKIEGYFPTPAPLVADMLERAGVGEGSRVLEPSAGSGAIADAARDDVGAAMVQCIERNSSLADILRAKGHAVDHGDFMDVKPSEYAAFDAVVMNPPFERGQDCAHVRHAWGFVRPGGRLVAIMGAGVTFRQNAPYSTFRAWVEGLGGEIIPIEAGAFKESGTGVASVMVVLEKDG